MAEYRKLNDTDITPDSLTRQWFSDTAVKRDKDRNPVLDDNGAEIPLKTKGSTFGTYAVAMSADGSGGMVIPLVSQKAADRAKDLAAEGWKVVNLPDSRLVEAPVAGQTKPKINVAQQEAMRAMLAGTATDEQKALLQQLV